MDVLRMFRSGGPRGGGPGPAARHSAGAAPHDAIERAPVRLGLDGDDLSARLDWLAEAVRRALALDAVHVLLADADGQWLTLIASTETPDELRVPLGPDGGALARACLFRRVIVWDGAEAVPVDLRLAPPYDALAPFRARVFALLPLVVDDRTVGVLAADRKRSRQPLSRDTVDCLELFAAEVAQAVRGVRRRARHSQSLVEVRAPLELAQMFTSTLELIPLLKQITRATAQLLGMDRCSVYLWEDGRVRGVMAQFADGHEDSALWQAFKSMERFRVEEFPAYAEAIRAARPILIEDAAASALVPDWWVRTFSLKSVMVVPLLRQERVVGVLQVDTCKEACALGPEQLSLAVTIASQVTLTIENARLYDRVKGHAATLAGHAGEARDIVAGCREVAGRGERLVREAVTGMTDLQSTSRRIADILGVIDEIAFQTNLLALNAAVEAARAGDHGRGFGVVAAEVRTLAQRSAAAAREIKGLIAESRHKVEVGTTLVGNAGRSFEEIVAAVRQVADIVSRMADAAGDPEGAFRADPR
ncbi:MAG TPA: methyl-accepting chemotaxis protein [Methylomirabilota bacterium]|nr:methyl-accepting chemotaxis protein [Methylomirabilota bacterium]